MRIHIKYQVSSFISSEQKKNAKVFIMLSAVVMTGALTLLHSE